MTTQKCYAALAVTAAPHRHVADLEREQAERLQSKSVKNCTVWRCLLDFDKAPLVITQAFFYEFTLHVSDKCEGEIADRLQAWRIDRPRFIFRWSS